MLIYNYKKEFLGIDKADLDALGLETLSDLRTEAADFADLFVRTPGCIHNFKHVHWIDYVLDKNGAEAKVIIHIKNKNYSSTLSIDTAYLVDNPSEKAFSVVLSNIKHLSESQTKKLLNDINDKPAPIPATGSTELFTTPGSIIHDGTASEIKVDMAAVEYDPYESEQNAANSAVVEDIYESNVSVEDLTADDAPLDIELEEMSYKDTQTEVDEIVEEPVEELKQEIQTKKTEQVIEGEFADYIYNPEVASDELGLPIDLIEEFIQDFITQANSFKEGLYSSIEEQEADNIKIQSHKLKGVAANLRIEDALDAITKVNISGDYDDIKSSLDDFYIMVDKLSGKKLVQASVTKNITEEKVDDDEDFIISFKEDKIADEEELSISDSDVPDNISIPELADDEFLNTQSTIKEVTEDLSILDEEITTLDNENIQYETLDTEVAYDKELIANDIGLDINSFNELFDDYIAEAKELSITILQSADNNDFTICKNLAGKLKGMSENMRINKLDSELDQIITAKDTQTIIEATNSIQAQISQLENTEV